MTQRKITVADIMSTKPCYPKTKVERLFCDLEYVTIEQILACDIPIADRAWLGVYLLAEKSHVVEFAKKCAKRAEGYVGSADPAYAAAAAAAAARAAVNAAAAARAAVNAAAAAEFASAADYATAAYYASAYYAAVNAAAADYAAANYAGIERDHQITHLLELHKREEKV